MTPIEHEPCRSRNNCHHARAARNVPRESVIRTIRKVNETWGKTPEAHEIKIRNGRKTSREAQARGGHNQPREAKVRGGCSTVESGHLARIGRGVPSTADGILFRSQIEAMFYCIMKALGGEPRANPPRIDLPDGRSYFPDFVLGHSVLDIPANVPIELKPARNAFYQKNLPKAIEAGAFVVYWNELVENEL